MSKDDQWKQSLECASVGDCDEEIRLIEESITHAVHLHRRTDPLSRKLRSSLQKILRRAELSARNRCQALTQLSRIEAHYDRQASKAHIDEAYGIAKKSRGFDALTHCQVLLALGSVLNQDDRLKDAEKYLVAGLKLAEKAKVHPRLRCDILQELGAVLNQMNRQDEAKRYLLRALKLSEKEDVDALTRCNILQELGSVLS